MRDLLLVVLAFLLQPVRWMLPGNLTVPLVLWLIAFVVSVATLVWLLRQARRVIRHGPQGAPRSKRDAGDRRE